MTDRAATRRWGEAWQRFWFTPAAPQPLAVVRILVGCLGLALLWSYAGDLEAWFGRDGLVPPDAAASWRGPWAVTLYDIVGRDNGLRLLAAATAGAFALLAVGLGGSMIAVMAAVLWASLLHRGPMLAGPADDCLSVLTWCVAVGPATAVWSLDAVRAAQRNGVPVTASWRARVALGLVRIHATVIAGAAALAQLKGDVWWDGTASWWLAARAESRLVDLTGPFGSLPYLQELVTHLVPGFEIAWAVGLWWPLVHTAVARGGLVIWPIIGVLAGEPFWGLAMAIFSVPCAWPSDDGR